MTIRIGVAGVTGRMGRLLAEEAGRLADYAGGTSRSEAGPRIFADIAALAAVSDIVVDFTHAGAVAGHAAALAAAGVPWVLGTTGYGADESAAIAAAAQRIPVLAAANFCTGVNIVMALAERLGAALPAAQFDAEILETHHRQKVDAPSGTALALGRAVAAGRGVRFEDVAVMGRAGHVGPRADGEIGFAVLRGGQAPGSHEVIFAAGDERIAISHDAFDRRVFATGAIRAALWLHGRAAGMHALREMLGL